MPIYEYACAACGNQFEEWQKMSDPPVRTCPKCKKKKVERLISRTAFQLKGSGWYADLYSSSKPGADGKSDGKSEGKSDSAKSESGDSAGGSDSKSAESKASTEGSGSKPSSGKASKKKESAAKKAESRAA